MSYFGKAFNDLHIELCLRQVPKEYGFERLRELFVNLEKLTKGNAELQAKLAKELVDLREFKRKNEEVAQFYPLLQQSFLELEQKYQALLEEYQELTSPRELLDE